VTEIGSIKLEVSSDSDLPLLERVCKDSLASHKYQKMSIPGKVSITRTLVEMSTVGAQTDNLILAKAPKPPNIAYW
jgi:hypothetical protein